MTPEEKIYAVLDGIPAISGRVFPDVAPYGTPVPYASYQRFGGVPVVFLDRAVPSKKNCFFQINVWSDNRIGAAVLIDAVEAALREAVGIQASPMSGPVAEHEDDLNLYGFRQDFNVWA